MDTAEDIMLAIRNLSNGERIKLLSNLNETYFKREPLSQEELNALYEDTEEDWGDLLDGKK